MSKRLMLLAAGVLATLAFTALPSMASANEFIATCSTKANCTATIAGGAAVLENDAGGAVGTVSCTASTGTATIEHAKSTGSVSLSFTGCNNNGFKCNSVGAAAGVINTGSLVSHLIYLEATTAGKKGVLLTNVNVTFECAGGLVKKTVTGNVIGEIEEPNCGTAKASHKINFEPGAATGSQQWTQITKAGTIFDLTSGTHASDTTTSSQKGTGTLTYNGGATVTLDC
jgi:hypothetical protein